MVTLLVGETTWLAVLGGQEGSGEVRRCCRSWLPFDSWLGMEGAVVEDSCCRSDMMCVPSGLVSLSLGRLCSCSGSSESSVELLRLRMEESDNEDDMITWVIVRHPVASTNEAHPDVRMTDAKVKLWLRSRQ